MFNVFNEFSGFDFSKKEDEFISPDEFKLIDEDISGIQPPKDEDDEIISPDEFNLPEEDISGIQPPEKDDFDIFEEDFELTTEDIFEEAFRKEQAQQRDIQAVRAVLRETEELFIRWSQTKGQTIARPKNGNTSHPFHLTNGTTSIVADVFLVDEETYLLKIIKEDGFKDVNLFVSELGIEVEVIKRQLSEHGIRQLFQF